MGTRIKGTTLIARLRYLDEVSVPDARRKVLESLAQADRDQLTKLLLPVREYPLELNARLDEAIARVLAPGQPPEGTYRRLGRASADHNTREFHTSFSHGTPHDVIARASQLRAQYYTDGVAKVVRMEPALVVIEITGATTVTLPDCESTAGFIERMVEIAGGKTKVTHPSCVLLGGEACVFRCVMSG